MIWLLVIPALAAVFALGAARALILAWTRPQARHERAAEDRATERWLHGLREQDELLAWAPARATAAYLIGGGPALPVAWPSMLPPRDEPPLEPLPPQVPHAAPDTPRTCWCGQPEGHVAASLAGGRDDEAFSTAQFPAVTADA